MIPLPGATIWVGGSICYLLSCTVVNAQQEAFSGTLSDYLALGEEGVRLGGTVFSEFRLLPLQTGTKALGPGVIDVTPLTGDGSVPGLHFSLMDGATAGDIFELHFSFRVTGSIFDGAYLSISDINASGDGGSDVSLGISHTGDPDTASLATLIAFSSPDAGEDLFSGGRFAPATDITIDFDAVIDGGNVGRPGEVTTSLGSASVRIEAAPRVISDPPVVSRSGFVDPATYYLEFFTAPSATYSVVASATLTDGFSSEVVLSVGDGTVGTDGFERVEFRVPPNATTRFFRVERTS